MFKKFNKLAAAIVVLSLLLLFTSCDPNWMNITYTVEGSGEARITTAQTKSSNGSMNNEQVGAISVSSEALGDKILPYTGRLYGVNPGDIVRVTAESITSQNSGNRSRYRTLTVIIYKNGVEIKKASGTTASASVEVKLL